MRHIGMGGYCDIAKAMLDAAEDFAACVRSVPELQIMGKPIMTVVAFKSIKRTFDIYQVFSLLVHCLCTILSLVARAEFMLCRPLHPSS